MQNRDLSDIPLLRTIAEIFGRSIWFNATVVLTHAASPVLQLAVMTCLSLNHLIHVVQKAICETAGDMLLMNPVSLVENHSACRANRAGQVCAPKWLGMEASFAVAFLRIKNFGRSKHTIEAA